MNIDKNGIDLICAFEGFRSSPYRDSAGVATIGYGSTYYKDGRKVTMSDKPISKDMAIDLMHYNLNNHFVPKINSMIKVKIGQDKFNAICSFCYNLGTSAFEKSTLLKKINTNPYDKTIKDEFMKWVNAGGKKVQGLVTRRQEEARIYFGEVKDINALITQILINLVTFR